MCIDSRGEGLETGSRARKDHTLRAADDQRRLRIYTFVRVKDLSSFFSVLKQRNCYLGKLLCESRTFLCSEAKKLLSRKFYVNNYSYSISIQPHFESDPLRILSNSVHM